ncbi:helix-turn-helix domain-containing protein [Leucobacter aridicollis]|uniref:Transcriptional regulator with XRE-family HTH domain n=1 Tax=Leucobacter aridicollis TaxID=283878 RepID=A0A852R0G0_9MICO|nr:helix-turn-helix transcriptional regulator [Leucobacter aridicollis]MBL3682608.1 helix-turn-helix domain-containing protein [Leucobacter aridicollis]NYD26027.1 transcriptional regulator with XRE-family HTH domain [Leucobacter aridicollis]
MVISWNELRDARERRNLTQEELAEQLGVSTRTITNWERVGVARKAEYKVRRFFGDDLSDGAQRPDPFAEIDYNLEVQRMTLSDRADHEGVSEFALALKEASDGELLEELQRRARKRGLAIISAGITPKHMQREVNQILRGERRRLESQDLNVGGAGNNVQTESDIEVPENVEEEWGLAAHPKTDLPQDHTP